MVTWSETSAAVAPRASMTQRARAVACLRVGRCPSQPRSPMPLIMQAKMINVLQEDP